MQPHQSSRKWSAAITRYLVPRAPLDCWTTAFGRDSLVKPSALRSVSHYRLNLIWRSFGSTHFCPEPSDRRIRNAPLKAPGPRAKMQRSVCASVARITNHCAFQHRPPPKPCQFRAWKLVFAGLCFTWKQARLQKKEKLRKA